MACRFFTPDIEAYDEMNILAIETSSSACSVALVCGERCIFREEHTPQAHARHVLPLVERVLAEGGMAPEALDCLAFDKGPGAFTGLRIAAATVQGLALGWDKPVVGISALAALAFQAQTQSPVLSLLDARMGEVYAAIYRQQTLLAGPVVAPPEALRSWLEQHGVVQGIGLAGDHASWISQHALQWTEQPPRADAVAFLAQREAERACKVTQQLPTPLYLRDKVADKPKKEVVSDV